MEPSLLDLAPGKERGKSRYSRQCALIPAVLARTPRSAPRKRVRWTSIPVEKGEMCFTSRATVTGRFRNVASPDSISGRLGSLLLYRLALELFSRLHRTRRSFRTIQRRFGLMHVRFRRAALSLCCVLMRSEQSLQTIPGFLRLSQ